MNGVRTGEELERRVGKTSAEVLEAGVPEPLSVSLGVTCEATHSRGNALAETTTLEVTNLPVPRNTQY